METKVWWLIISIAIVAVVLLALNLYIQHTTRESFAVMNSVCKTGLDQLIRRSMMLEDGGLPNELKTICIIDSDFYLATAVNLMSRSSVYTMLFNLFQSADGDGIPYIARFYKWEYSKAGSITELAKEDWNRTFQIVDDNQDTESLASLTLIPMIIDLCRIFRNIIRDASDSSKAVLGNKYNNSMNAANRQFINGFLSKYSGFNDTSASKLKTDKTEENTMFKALVDNNSFGYAAAIKSKTLKQAIPEFAISYLLKVNFTSSAQCNIDIMETPVDNDVELYIRLKKLYDMWRKNNATGAVNWTAADLNSSLFTATDDLIIRKDDLVKYILELVGRKNEIVKNQLSAKNIDDAVTEINKLINKEFITSGGSNDGKLRDDSSCLDAQLLCNLRIDKSLTCIPNNSGCAGVDDFNKYCTAVNQIIDGNRPNNTLPALDTNNLQTTPTTTAAAATAPAGTSSTTAATALAGATAPAGTTAPAGIPGATSSGAGAPLLGGVVSQGSASNEALKTKLAQHAIPAYLDRSTQELLIFVYEKLSASYNLDDEDVPDDIKQAISQLPPSGKANICNRYCQLTTRCNGICKLAGCLNCQIGTGSQAGSDVNGSADTSLGYAGIDDEYNLLGFLDDISQSKLLSGGTSGGSVTGSGYSMDGTDQYKHMGPMISQKDTSGVSNIFAPYIIMTPKKDGSAYGAYLLDDPNDPNYRQYIDDLVKSY